MISVFAHTHARCAHKGAHKRTHSRSLNGKQTSLRICNIISDWIRPTQEKSRTMVGIHSHTFRMRGNGSDISCFFLLVLHFNSPHHAILNGNRFGNTIPKCDPPCVRVAYSEYRIGFGTSIQCLKFHIQICCERQRTIYFILHKRKIKLSFIRIPNNMYKKPQATPLD